ncbi:hypothetical protein [Paenibacillus tengchongensis]|uniref:hypothetical protein n=1 Tax=Paenibacillus tengchongensis TaxID=2608684 RepID=UPI00124D53CC|nr:hypothetical protein [Paenibacillus tengchongensis]
MKLDEQRGLLYVTASEKNELLFISKDTLQIKKRLAVGNNPQGMELAGNKLYVALGGATLIAVVDLDSQTVVNTIPTQLKPYQVAVDGNSLFYADGDQWCDIHRIDLNTGKDTTLMNMIYTPQLAVDREQHILYAGESGSRIAAFSATYGDLQGVFEPEGGGSSLVIHSEEVYFGSLQLDFANRRILSSYSGGVLAVDGSYIYTGNGIYTKAEGIPVVKYEDSFNYPDVIEVDQSHAVYSFSRWSPLLYKRVYDLPEQPKAVEYQNSSDQIRLNRDLNAWAAGNDERYFYAVSTETNRLLQIDSHSFEVLADRYIGSMPTDVDIRDGIIYVALNGSTHIAKIDTADETNFMAPITELEIGQTTLDVAAGKGKVYYTGRGGWGKVGVFESVYTIYPQTYSSPHLTMNEDASMLYIGETGISRSNLFMLDTRTDSVLQSTNGDFGFGSPVIIPDGEFVYYTGQRIDADNLSMLYGSYKDGYYTAKLLAARDKLVIGSNTIYDRDTFNPIYKLPFIASYGYIKKDGSILLFSENAGQYSLTKYDSFDSMKSDQQDGMRPVAAYFIDEDWDALSLDGELTLFPGPQAVNVQYYKIRYLDAGNQVVNGVSDDYIYAYEKQVDGYYIHQLSKRVPAEVQKIGLIPVISTAYGEPQVL